MPWGWGGEREAGAQRGGAELAGSLAPPGRPPGLPDVCRLSQAFRVCCIPVSLC